MNENSQRQHLLFTELVTRFEEAVRATTTWPPPSPDKLERVERLRAGLIDAFTVQLNEVEEAQKK